MAHQLGYKDFDEKLFAEQVDYIECFDDHIITHFYDGSIKNSKWSNPSRKDSWTDDMKEKARQTRMDQDIRNINDKGVINYLNEIENAELSDAFWDFGLPQKLDTPNSTAPALSTFFAAQIVKGDKGLFSPNSSVRDLFGVSDVHHIFPKDYLKKTEFLDNRSIYNQVANYTYLDTPINIAVGNKAPNVYFKEAFESALKDGIVYGNHMSVDELKSNLIENCIPLDIVNWDYNDYRNKFLVERRKLMAKKIKEYYNNL